MLPNFAARGGVADVDFTWSLSMDLRFRKERVYEKHRPCSPLAFSAITNMDQHGFAVCLYPQRAAGTLSNFGHALPPDLPIVSYDPMIRRPPHEVECSSISNSALNGPQKTRRLLRVGQHRGVVRRAGMTSGRLACRNLNRVEERNDVSHGLIEVLVQEEVTRIWIELELGSGNQTRKLLRATN